MPEVTQGATEPVATQTTPTPSAVLEAKFADREAMRGKSKAERAALARTPTKVEAVAPAAPEKPPEPKVEEKKEEPKEDTEPGKKPVEEAPVEEEKAGKGFAALAKQEAKFQAERKAWEQQRRAAETADAEKGKDTSTKIAAFESASKRVGGRQNALDLLSRAAMAIGCLDGFHIPSREEMQEFRAVQQEIAKALGKR